MNDVYICCLYKRYHLLNVSVDNRVSFSSALSESRRLFLRSLFLVDRRSLASAVSDCAARLALSLPRRLDNRVSSSSALSESRRLFLRSLSLVDRRSLAWPRQFQSISATIFRSLRRLCGTPRSVSTSASG